MGGRGSWVLDTQEDVSRPSASVSEKRSGSEAGWGKALRGAEPASPELGCCQSHLLGALVP